MKIFGWTADDGGLAKIRVKVPLDELAKHGHEVAYNMYFDRKYGMWDTIVGSRIAMTEPTKLWTSACGMPGGPFCVYETDDDLLRVSMYNDNGPQQFWSRPDVRFRYAGNLRVSHRVVTSTNYLANILHDQFGHPDIVVTPNCVPGWMLDLPPVPDPEDGPVIIGWAGGDSHRGDWEWTWNRRGIGRTIRKLGPDLVKVHFVGVDYSHLLKLPPEQVMFTPWTNNTDLHWRERLNFHIGLAPLRPEAFNKSKSDIKLREYMIRGIVPIASDYGPYPETIVHGKTGFLVTREDQWAEAIRTLVFDAKLRRKMGLAAKEAAKGFTIEANWQTWEEAYTP